MPGCLKIKIGIKEQILSDPALEFYTSKKWKKKSNHNKAQINSATSCQYIYLCLDVR